MSLDSKVTAEDERVQEIESQLRELLVKYNDLLVSLSVDPAISKREFVSQVMERVAALAAPGAFTHGTPGVISDGSGFVRIVSVDVSQALVHSLLRCHAKTYPPISKFLEKILEGEEDADTGSKSVGSVIPGGNFVADTHITMVHFSQINQSAMRDQFEALIGCAVDVTVTGIIWNDRIAALAVEVATETVDKPGLEIPAPKNSFPHITLWHQQDVSARDSNELPGLVERGDAERIDFSDPSVIQGSISFWGEDRG